MADPDEAPIYYTNAMQASIGAYDLTLDFGWKPPETPPNAAPKPVCRVAMSLSHAKTMLPIMARLIAQYEEQFGVIPAPGYDDKAKE